MDMQYSNAQFDYFNNDSAQIVDRFFDTTGFSSEGGFHLSRINSTAQSDYDFEISQYLDSESRRYPDYQAFMKPKEVQLASEENNNFSTQGELNHTSEQYFEQENQKNDEKTLEAFHKGHIAFLSKRRRPIFPVNRKIHKTKKTNKHNQSYYGIIDKYMPGKVKGSSKRFDQKIQSQYEKLSVDEQKDQDQTYAAIRKLKVSNDEESKKILNSLEVKYLKCRKIAVFLNTFANQA